jgi:hypothetical protein
MSTRRSTRKRLARKGATLSANSAEPCIWLRSDDGIEARIDLNRKLSNQALHWCYRVRNRARWRQDATTLDNLEIFAQRDLRTLGVEQRFLDQIVASGFVEVSVPWAPEATEANAHRFPWEAVLNLATRTQRDQQTLVVSRHLQRSEPVMDRSARGGVPLVVVSSPGKIGIEHNFEDERALILNCLGQKDPRMLTSPSLAKLEAAIREGAPAIIHLTGMDAHQGATVLEYFSDEPVEDGFYMVDDKDCPVSIPAKDLAEAITMGNPSPTLVTTNFYNSAARMGIWVVARGTNAAIGFQDEVDDVIAERFFGDFYSAWKTHRFDLRQAFEEALKHAREGGSSIRGSGIVLWSARSLVNPARAAGRSAAARKAASKGRTTLPDPVIIDKPPDGTGKNGNLDRYLKVMLTPRSELNYALLHNNVDLFKSFLFRKFDPRILKDIQVDVALTVGTEQFKYGEMLRIEKPLTDINHAVRVPLTWDYLRTMRETTRTVLVVDINWGKKNLYKKTLPVQLHPLEQWHDDPQENRYLASFVQPGDPAVAKIIDRARPYLRALLDDPEASFDGYQSVDLEDEDPYAWVDLQVQAIWSAIAFDLNLAYTNPLATPGESYQRLRCPSEILRSRFGTCIDLALLFASCLEFVEIYPVIFLIEGHSFPGYWRGEGLHDRFVQIEDGTEADLEGKPGPLRAQSSPWMLDGQNYREIVHLVKKDQLVPLETTLLASRGAFGTATEQGSDNLESEEEFDSMIDVKCARSFGVNPLPLWRTL